MRNFFYKGLPVILAGLVTTMAGAQSTTVYDSIYDYSGATTQYVVLSPAQPDADNPANITSRLVCQKVMVDPQYVGMRVSGFTFVAGSISGHSVTARACVRTYKADGPQGGPGTFLYGVDYGPYVMGAGGGVFIGNGGGVLTIPADHQFWFGVCFDNKNGTTGATTEDLATMAHALYKPPVIGSTQAALFKSTGPGNYKSNNPAGIFEPAPYEGLDLGMALSVRVLPAPEPTTMIVLGMGALALLRRRKKA